MDVASDTTPKGEEEAQTTSDQDIESAFTGNRTGRYADERSWRRFHFRSCAIR